jgi:hypothetical protein
LAKKALKHLGLYERDNRQQAENLTDPDGWHICWQVPACGAL